MHELPLLHPQDRADPQLASVGCFVTLHSPPSERLPVHAGAPVQQTLFAHCLPPVQVPLQSRAFCPSVRHEFATGAHEGATLDAHESVRVQQLPITPSAGGFPGAPVRLSTHSWFPPQPTSTVVPQPVASFLPHCPASWNCLVVFGVQH
jgi:hypothetical protein